MFLADRNCRGFCLPWRLLWLRNDIGFRVEEYDPTNPSEDFSRSATRRFVDASGAGATRRPERNGRVCSALPI